MKSEAFTDRYGVYWMNDDGVYHHEEGPAVVNADGETFYFINNVDITEKVNAWIKEFDINPNWNQWTDSDKILFKMRFV